MCEPFTIAAVTTLGSLAATAVGSAQQQRAAASQNRANQYWRDYQEKQRKAEQGRQDELRLKAEQARANTVDQMGAEEQGKAQAAEEERLKGIYNQNPTVPQNTDDLQPVLLSGQENGGQVFKDDVASRLAQASVDARKRIGALARINSYGGSFGGLQGRNAEVLGAGDTGINTANNMRQGSLSAYNIAKGINPMQMPNTTDYASGIGSALAGIAGTAWGQSFRAPTIGKV